LRDIELFHLDSLFICIYSKERERKRVSEREREREGGREWEKERERQTNLALSSEKLVSDTISNASSFLGL